MFCVYLIQNDVSKELYVGYTSDLKRRLSEHNGAGKKHTTRNVGEWKYVYVELYRNEKDARERESKLKQHGSGKQKLLKRLKESLF